MTLSIDEKISLLLELTRGPSNVYALRSTRSDGEEYWQPIYAPLTPETIQLHFAGLAEVGNYALVAEKPMPKTWWIAADFDGKKPGVDWQTDVKRATQFLVSSGANVFVNLSRSTKGAHIRVLFKEAVPAWMARRWMLAWLEEAGVVLVDPETWDKTPPSFDLLVPRQDVLTPVPTTSGKPNPGNLVGAPLNGRRATTGGGTLPLRVEDVLEGNFTPDGNHWDHVRRALDERAWGEDELRQALRDCPSDVDLSIPEYGRYFDSDGKLKLPVLSGGSGEAAWMINQCKFFEYMRSLGEQPYYLWVAMASELHAFGDAGRELFHELSALDPRYDSDATERKWRMTATMHPVRCDTLMQWGFRCKHLDDQRCGTAVPANLPKASRCEIL